MSRNATCQPSFAEPPLASNVPGGDAVGAGGPPPPISANANVLADVGEQLLRAEKVIVSKLDAKGAPQRAFGTYILVVTRMDDEVRVSVPVKTLIVEYRSMNGEREKKKGGRGRGGRGGRGGEYRVGESRQNINDLNLLFEW